jgi:hypothetical protein
MVVASEYCRLCQANNSFEVVKRAEFVMAIEVLRFAFMRNVSRAGFK